MEAKKTDFISLYIIISLLLIFFTCCQTKYKERADNALEVFLNALEKHNKTNMAEPFAIRAWYAECALIEEECVAYTDGLGLLVSHGHDCIIPPASFTFLPTNMRKSPRDARWLAFMENTYRKVGRGLVEQTDFNPAYKSLLNAFRWFEIEGPFSPDNIDKYSIHSLNSQEDHISISFEPEGKFSRFYFKGKLYFNGNTLQLDSVVLSNTYFYSNQHFSFVDGGWLKIYYSHDGNRTWMSKLNGGYNTDDANLTVYLETLDPSPVHPELEQLDFHFMLGFSENPKISYDPEVWKGFVLPSGNKLNMAVCCLIEDSYTDILPNYHGKPYYTEYYDDGSIETYHIDEKEITYVKVRTNQILEQLNELTK